MPEDSTLNTTSNAFTTSGGGIRANTGGGFTVSYQDMVASWARQARRPQLDATVNADESVFVDETEMPPRQIPLEVMKQRHLNGSERMAFHKPKKDWIVTDDGKEICRSAVVLVVDDLVEMCR